MYPRAKLLLTHSLLNYEDINVTKSSDGPPHSLAVCRVGSLANQKYSREKWRKYFSVTDKLRGQARVRLIDPPGHPGHPPPGHPSARLSVFHVFEFLACAVPSISIAVEVATHELSVVLEGPCVLLSARKVHVIKVLRSRVLSPQPSITGVLWPTTCTSGRVLKMQEGVRGARGRSGCTQIVWVRVCLIPVVTKICQTF